MKRFVATLAWSSALAVASQAMAQSDNASDEETPEAAADEAGVDVNLDAIDALLGNTEVSSDDAGEADLAGEADDVVEEGDPDDEEPIADDAPAEDDPDAAEPSDLDRAYAVYATCASIAGEAMESRGFSMEIIGEEALLRCAGERAAYVNAFYFALLPRYSAAGEGEAAIRTRAEHLVTATDRFLITKVGEEAAALRAAREAEVAAAAAAEAAALAEAAAEAAAIEAAAEQGEDTAEPSSEDDEE